MESYSNISFLYIEDLVSFVEDSPFEKLVGSSKLSTAKFVVENNSNIFRILLLYLYGGVYFDLDVISLKEFNEKLPINFVIAKDSGNLNNAILSFSKGHPFLQLLMGETVSNAWIKRIEYDNTCQIVKSYLYTAVFLPVPVSFISHIPKMLPI